MRAKALASAVAVGAVLAVCVAGCGSDHFRCPAAKRGPGAPAINVSPGVVTVARLRTPDGRPFSLTLQRICFQGAEYLCENVVQLDGSGGDCLGPVPLEKKPLISMTGDPSGCTPRQYQLVWGIAQRNVSVALVSPTGEQAATRRPIPNALRAPGDLYHVWAYAAPDHLIARNAKGKIVESDPINDTARPYFCRATGRKSAPPSRQPLGKSHPEITTIR